MGCQQCLPLSVVKLKGKHCQKPHCRNGVVGTFGHTMNDILMLFNIGGLAVIYMGVLQFLGNQYQEILRKLHD